MVEMFPVLGSLAKAYGQSFAITADLYLLMLARITETAEVPNNLYGLGLMAWSMAERGK
jgi:hypothetical protein